MNSRLYNVRNWPRALQVGKEQAGFNPSVFPGLQHPAPSALCCLLPSYLRCCHFSCSNRTPHTGWLHQQTFIPHSLEVGKTKIKTWWDPLPCLQLTVFLLCPHVRNHLSQVPFIKAPITSNGVPPSSPNHLPKAHLLMSSHWGVGFQWVIFAGGINSQYRAFTLHLFGGAGGSVVFITIWNAFFLQRELRMWISLTNKTPLLSCLHASSCWESRRTLYT